MNDKFVKILKEKGLSRYKLSKMSGVPQSTLADWVNTDKAPSLPTLTAVADALGVSIDYLIGRVDEGQNKTPTVYGERDVKVLEAFKKLSPELRDATYRYILTLVKAQIDEDSQ